MSTIFSNKPRFKIGERVKVIRPGLTLSAEGFVLSVDKSGIVNRYLVEFENIRQERFPEFDLYPVAPEVPAAQPVP